VAVIRLPVFRVTARIVKLVWYFGGAGLQLMLHPPRNQREGAEWLHNFCARVIAGFGITITAEGAMPARGALISDHLSYLDIIVYAALEPVVFFAKAELEHAPIIGKMATAAGTVYVERGAGGSAMRARAGLISAADLGVPVLFFPEGTTTNGTHLLPFHSGLLGETMAAEEPITVAHIHYTLDQDNGPGVSVEDDVCYWGDTTLLQSIFRFLRVKGAHAWVRIAPAPIAFSPEALANRRVAAVEARNEMLALAGPSFYPDEISAPQPEVVST